MKRALLIFTLAAATQLAHAADLTGFPTDTVNPVPPKGIVVTEADRAEIEKGVAELGADIRGLQESLKSNPALLELLPDVQIYEKAADWAVRYNEIFKTNEIATAKAAIQAGKLRAKSLKEGKAPWLTQTGPIVRGFKSRIDGSIQPYGLVVPPTFVPGSSHKYRVDFWFHGRGETMSELSFVADRSRNPGQFTPPETIVLHLYNRFCNPARFAGETDVFEAWAQVKKYYHTDENRVVVRGFSMGGASCWDFAVHHCGLWAAAAPGAGFSETADFLKIDKQPIQPSWWERKLWSLYDATDTAINIFNVPTVAYSGELDGQRQAADMMAAAMLKEGLVLTQVIGPKTKHAYEPTAKKEVEARVDALAAKGRNPAPAQIKYATYTLRYDRCFWVVIDGLGQHWEQGRVDASWDKAKNAFDIKTTNLTGLTLQFTPGLYDGAVGQRAKVTLDGQTLETPAAGADHSLTAHFRKTGTKWSPVADTTPTGLTKQHGLQGPIDDAFMDSFVMVKPTGKPLNEKVGNWALNEMAHAEREWRRQFRGDAVMKNDADITDADIAANNLVLWGDPQSNRVLAKIADKLPIRWSAAAIKVGNLSYPGADYVPVLIFPNPLNPKKYVVLNSSFTYREYDYLNNARQTPKLPDWAVVDVNQPMTSRAPGGIVNAGFFGEHWELKSPGK